MKFSLVLPSIVAIYLLPSLVQAEECDATYSVNFAANYTDNIPVKCTTDQMDLITKVIHSVVELDSIASQLSSNVPDFKFFAEQYQEGVIIDSTGHLTKPLDAEEIIEHMTEEDLMEDLYYAAGLEDQQIKNQEKKDDKKKEESGVEFAKLVVADESEDPEHRRAQTVDCSLLEGCTSTWCCNVCGFCWTRRRRQLAAAAAQGGNLRAPRALEAQPVHDEEYLERVKLHEERVSAELLKKFRFLMRKDNLPCLGNFWELEVFFKLVF